MPWSRRGGATPCARLRRNLLAVSRAITSRHPAPRRRSCHQCRAQSMVSRPHPWCLKRCGTPYCFAPRLASSSLCHRRHCLILPASRHHQPHHPCRKARLTSSRPVPTPSLRSHRRRDARRLWRGWTLFVMPLVGSLSDTPVRDCVCVEAAGPFRLPRQMSCRSAATRALSRTARMLLNVLCCSFQQCSRSIYRWTCWRP